MARIFSVDFRRSANDLMGAVPTFGSTATINNDSKGMALKCKSAATDYITYGDIAAINAIGTGAFSFVVGANIKGFLNHGSGVNAFAGKGNPNTSGIVVANSSGTNIIVYILNSAISSTIIPYRDNLIIVTRNLAGLCTLYVNGISMGTPVTNTGTISSTSVMAVGYDGNSTSRTPNASIYLSEVYNHCLSQQEIDNLVMDFNARTIVSKPIRGFIQNRPTDLSQLKGTGPTQGLVAAYNMINQKGTLVDISGNLKNGTIVGRFIQNKEGLTSYGVFANQITIPALTPFGTGNFTFCTRVSFASFAISNAVIGGLSNSPRMYVASDNKVWVDNGTNNLISNAGAITTLNQFYNICYVKNSNVGTFYINGAAWGGGADNTNYTVGNTILSGYAGANFNLNGTNADCRIFNRALSLQEIKNYSNSFVNVVLYEDFSNYAVGDTI